ncbi:MAG TPA: hypothetical protein VM890_01755, partial [Longimicrobium sp.]|nr:hypothetical protein [Longimicrobium sp.]
MASIPPPPTDPPQAERRRFFLPTLVPGLVAALFLAILWHVGVRPQAQPNDFPPFRRVTQPLISAAQADSLEGRARTLKQQAEALDQAADSLTGPLN